MVFGVVNRPSIQLSARSACLSPELVELLDLLYGKLNLPLYQNLRPPFGYDVRKLEHRLDYQSRNACKCHEKQCGGFLIHFMRMGILQVLQTELLRNSS